MIISIFPIGSEPYGLSYGQWTVKWWQWLLAIPKHSNPTLDNSGDYAYLNQRDPNVFYLCQTYEKSNFIPKRKVSLGSRQSLLMPIINWISFSDHDGDNNEHLVLRAKERMDVIKDLRVKINGMQIEENFENYRVRSLPFCCVLPKDNILEVPQGTIRAISDGYWLFLSPFLTESELQIESLGSCSSGATTLGVSYDITFD